MSHQKISFYNSIRDVAPSREIEIREFVAMVHEGVFEAQVQLVRTAATEDEKRLAKMKLPAVQLSGCVTTGNRAKALAEDRFIHSGYLQLDIDGNGLNGTTAEAARAALASDRHVLSAFISPSGAGAKALFKVTPCATDDEHKQAFNDAQEYILTRYGLAIDPSTKDSGRLCYVPSDLNCTWNDSVIDFQPPAKLPEVPRHEVKSKPSKTFPEPPENGIHDWLPLAARWCETHGLTESEAVEKIRSRDGQMRRRFSDNEPEDACRLIYSTPSAERGLRLHAAQESKTYSPTIADSQWHEIERRIQVTGGKYQENVFAAELKSLLPKILTTGNLWRVFDGSRWEPIAGPDRFLPLALELLGHFNHDTVRRAGELVEHVGAVCQTTQEWRGAYALADDGAVLLNLSNGILRVTQEEIILGPHDWSQGFTLTIPTAWEPGAECSAFTATLSAAMPDPDDRELFRLFAGSILEPSARLEAGLAVFGPSGTGKSTLIDSGIAEAIGGPGAGTVSRVSLRQLCDPKSYSLPGLEFSLVNIITEGDALEVEESGNFKSIISGEPIECREIYGKPRVIATTAKLLLATNSLPRFRNGTDAEGRRLRLLNFDQVPSNPDPELKHRIHAEGPGILRWMAEALQDVLGLRNMPRGGASAKRVTDRFALSNDSLGCFVKQECAVDPAGWAPRGELLGGFNEFADSHGFSADNASWFFRKLFDRFPHLTDKKRGGVRGINGITINPNFRAG